MAQSIEERLLEAIEKDDIKAFDALMEEAPCGAYRLGRFPVLSLLYLFSARKITSAHEETFAKISAWKPLSEPASAARLFAERAGKCLRLYLSEVVSPPEMLLILDRTKQLKKIYPLTRPSEAAKERLKTIYSVKYSLEVRFEGNEIILDRRPRSRREKKKIAIVCLSCILAATLAVATPVTVVSLLPKRAEGEVTKLSHIDFSAQTTYTLKADITIPDNYSVEKVNCSFIGGGKKFVFGKNATLGEFSGTLSDLEIQTAGSPIFTACTEKAVLSDVTVNVDADIKSSAGSALIALTNCGTFDGVTVNVGGKISAFGGASDDTEELIFGGMVALNSYSGATPQQRTYGTIKNCTVHYSNLSLMGELSANATFGGIVGVNDGIVQDCKVTGAIFADTFDLSGACYVNYNLLSGIVNEANLSQTADIDDWTPIVGGIVTENVATVEYCTHTGKITVEGSDAVICGGISARTYGRNNYCMSTGDISVTGKDIYAGGIFGRSEIIRDDWYIYCGFADHCIASGKIEAALGEGTSCIGGIGGLIQEGKFYQYVYDASGLPMTDDDGNFLTEPVYLGGGITNCIFLGEIEGSGNYIGNIVGVCGEEIYEHNSYISDNTEHQNFDGNYYLENDLPSFGAVVAGVAGEEIFREVGGKGATLATGEEIKETEIYKDILEKLGM